MAVAQALNDRQDAAHRLDSLAYLAARLGQFDRAQARFEEALRQSRDIGDRDVEFYALSGLSWLNSQVGQFETARELAEQAVAIAEGFSGAPDQALAWLRLGHARLGLRELDGAREAYQQACARLESDGVEYSAVEARAGLIRVCLAEGDAAAAAAQAEQLLPHLASPLLAQADEPARVALSCYQALQAVGAPQARDVLAEAYRRLQTLSAALEDGTRRTFLENVPENRELLETWRQAGMTTSA